MTDDLTQSRALVREQVRQARVRSAAMRETIMRARTTPAVVRSTGGEVAVTATADGAVTDIRFGDAAEHLDPRRLARLLVRTIDQAQREAAHAAVAATRADLGDSGYTDLLEARVTERYGPYTSPR
ncbi:MAG: YbaB/EbfC family nucleoid-associated protein [Micrococcales bacterium]|nr:YbaB/EbfC family nucleoid-associated protein [Micrococcales bacterium]